MKRVILPFIILAAGFGIAAGLIATGPVLEQKPPVFHAPLVRVTEARPEKVRMTARTHGTVEPRTESELIPEVSGRVISISPSLVSGGFFSRGDVLFSIDPLDYDVALEQARAGLARAESELVNARRAHARQLDLAKKQSTSASRKDDALNRLRVAEAGLREARARLAKAERDITRTRIIAPFDGRVRTKKVDVGQFVNRGVPVATIYATDRAEIRLPVNNDELAFLDLQLSDPGEEAPPAVPVKLRVNFAGKPYEWDGTIVRTEGELDPRTRMMNVVAEVLSPYETDDGRPPLAVGLFVDAEIYGVEMDDVVVLPRVALRTENRVYVVDADRRLRFRDVEVLRIAEDKVYIQSGLKEGEQVCLSPLDSAVEGMSVRLHADTGIASS